MNQTAIRSPETLLPARQVWERYGIVSRTLDRWEEDGRLNFPLATKINGRRYWRLADLESWERARAADSRKAA